MSDAEGPVLELKAVHKHYGAVHALRGVDVVVPRASKVIGLLGPNGAGKSTLVKAMLGVIPYEGQARVLGIDPKQDGAAVRARVGYMPEGDVFLSGMSAVELCTYAGELSGLPRTEAMQRAHASLYYAGLEDKRYQDVDGYSTGMKQRVKLAQALVHDPELLFLDEPTNGLDPRARDEMLDLIIELPEKRGCNIMVSTHLLTDVDRVCDTAIIMHKGQVRFTGTIEELRATSVTGTDVVIEVRDQGEALAAALRKRGAEVQETSRVGMIASLPTGLDSRGVMELARAAGIQLRTIEPHRASMEQAFLRVVGEGGTL